MEEAMQAETKKEKRARKRAERAARRAERKKEGGFWKDFKAFISRGNIIDLAVAVVVGAAFTAIVNSFVNDIIQPFITWLVGSKDLSELVVVLREAQYAADGVTVMVDAITLNYGNLIMAILTFLIDALVIFTIVRVIRKAGKRLRESGEKLKEKLEQKEENLAADKAEEPAAEAPAAEPAPAPAPVAAPAASSENVEKLLAEIRDLLRAGNAGQDGAAPSEAPAADEKTEK